MYSCSQCDFKTHIEAMFKQHVDSVHLGISNTGNNIILSPNNVIATATTGAVAVNPVAVTATLAGSQVPQTVVVATPAQAGVTGVAQKPGIVTLTTGSTAGGSAAVTTASPAGWNGESSRSVRSSKAGSWWRSGTGSINSIHTLYPCYVYVVNP